jgi:hypothetical protein
MSETAKIAEVTPEHLAGFGDKYAPEQFTDEALDKILSGAYAEQEQETAQAAPAPETAQIADTPPEAPTPAPVEPTKAGPGSAEDLESLRKKYQVMANERNTYRQKAENYDRVLNDPEFAKKVLQKKTGLTSTEVESLFHRDENGQIDLNNPRNGAAVSESLSAITRELEEARSVANQARMELERIRQESEASKMLSAADMELSRFGVAEALGESFSEADRKWTVIYNELGAEGANKFLADENYRRAHPHLAAPKNLDAYVKVVKAYRAKDQFDLGTLLQAQGIVRPQSVTTKPDPQEFANRAQSNKLAQTADTAQLPPANAGSNVTDHEREAKAFLATIADKDKLTPEEDAKLDFYLRQTQGD